MSPLPPGESTLMTTWPFWFASRSAGHFRPGPGHAVPGVRAGAGVPMNDYAEAMPRSPTSPSIAIWKRPVLRRRAGNQAQVTLASVMTPCTTPMNPGPVARLLSPASRRGSAVPAVVGSGVGVGGAGPSPQATRADRGNSGQTTDGNASIPRVSRAQPSGDAAEPAPARSGAAAPSRTPASQPAVRSGALLREVFYDLEGALASRARDESYLHGIA